VRVRRLADLKTFLGHRRQYEVEVTRFGATAPDPVRRTSKLDQILIRELGMHQTDASELRLRADQLWTQGESFWGALYPGDEGDGNG